MAIPLTKRQKQILDWLTRYISEIGVAPSLQEIGQALGMSSLATVHKHLENLKEKGYIRRSRHSIRSIEVLSDGDRCPTCGRPHPVAAN